LYTRANSGSETINIIPATSWHPRARIRVKCSDNVFYDISDADLNIVGSSTDPTDRFSDNDIPLFFDDKPTNAPGNTAPVCGIPVTCSSDGGVSSGGGGGGAVDGRWLLLCGALFLLSGGGRRRRVQGLQ
jgi:hypothetical protein